MNTNDQLSMGADLDNMLSAFFKAELPDPFPTLKLPVPAAKAEPPMPVAATSNKPADRHSTISKSRLSLAVSVVLLLGGCWYLSGQIGKAPERGNTINRGDDKATLPKAIQKATDDKKPAMP